MILIVFIQYKKENFVNMKNKVFVDWNVRYIFRRAVRNLVTYSNSGGDIE